MRTSAVIALVNLLTACDYSAEIKDCRVACSDVTGCPDGLSCSMSDGFCRSPGVAETCAEILGEFPSCVGLAQTCGPNADEDCCSTATPLPSGTFFRSYDVGGDGMYPSTSYPATVSPFVLDRFEVTVGRFRVFVEAAMGTRANPPSSGAGARRLNGMDGQGGWDASWNTILATDTTALIAAVKCDGSKQTWTDAAGANEELPINCVTWFEAFAFCAWDGGFLPTEAEWNYAAAGGDEQRAYPWSSPAGTMTVDCTYANHASCENAVSRVGSVSPKGDGKWGHADLAGNVWEWVMDWYATPYPTTPCNDCVNLTPGALRVNRGGGFSHAVTYLRAALRGFENPAPHYASIGIRCARPTL